MAKKSDEILNQCLEIEGLLALISKREDNTPQLVYEMLRNKTAELNASVVELCECARVGMNVQADTDEIAISETAEEEELADADVDGAPFGVLPSEVAGADIEIADASTTLSVESDDTAIEDSEVGVFEPVEVDYAVTVSEESTTDAPKSLDKDVEPILPPADEPLELPQYEPLDATPVSEATEYDDETQQAVLSDKFAEFTLNDKFRFRRELFGNSDIDMNEALDVVNAMSSRDEVEDYFYNDMCWDPANEDVKDFMRIVTAKFN